MTIKIKVHSGTENGEFMNNLKIQILKNRINCNPAEVLEVMGNMNAKTLKTYAIVSNQTYISSFRKTLKGATAHAERSLTQWYDEYTMDMTNNVNDVIEIYYNDLTNYSTDIMAWYEFLKSNRCAVTNYTDVKYFYNTYVDGFLPNNEVMEYINKAVECIQNGLCIDKPEIKEEVKKEVEEVQTLTIEKTQDQQIATSENVKVVFNEDKNGIELYFDGKPSEEVRTQLKNNGFRWAKFNKCWYVKDTSETREFIKKFTVTSNQDEAKNTVAVESIDMSVLDDLDSYIIDSELSKKENDGSMFRSKDLNHHEILQKQLLSFTNDIKSVVNNLELYEQRKLINKFQAFKKKYHSAYIESLHAKINAPSWALTGRGNLNMNQYEKKQNRLTNKYLTLNDLYNDMSEYIENLKTIVKKRKTQKELNDFYNDVQKCEHVGNIKKMDVKINAGATNNIFTNPNRDVNAYVVDGNIYIIKTWGSFHIYDKSGNFLYDHGMSLKDAKKYASYFSNKMNIVAS